jgi:hypothetical protein
MADDLIDFAMGKKWRDKLLEASRDCAKQSLQDATTFATAFDDGEFRS